MEGGGVVLTFGERLRQERVRAGITQDQLACQAGISVRAIRDIEHGVVARPRVETVRRILSAVRVSEPAFVAAADAPDEGSARLTVCGGRDEPTVAILGPLVVRHGGRAVGVQSAMQRSLLGLLALHAPQVVSRTDIVDVLWDSQPPRTCMNLVHIYVGRLRQLLEPGRPAGGPASVVVADSGGYRLNLDRDQLDLACFDDVAAQARAAQQSRDSEAAFALGERALQCWRGRVLANAAPRVRAHPAAVLAEQRRLGVTLDVADAAIILARFHQAATALQRLALDEPLHEGLHARLMLALAGCGQQAAALRLYQDLRQRLAEELGIEPGPELTSAHLRVLRGEVAAAVTLSATGRVDDVAPTPPVATPRNPASSASATPAQLPLDVRCFTGRTRELTDLDALTTPLATVSAARVVILSGTPGVGKTALAVHWAHRVGHAFPDGQLYADLRGAAPEPPLEPLVVLTRFLTALGVPPERIPLDVDEAAARYRSELADRRLLVLLDDAGNPDQVRPLLPGAGNTLTLVTSRDALTGLVARDGAHAVTLQPLTPAETHQLLRHVLGTRRVAAEPDAATELGRLCARLPLALRIAAANLIAPGSPTIAGYVARLRTGDRLTALSAGEDDQTAVRAAFELSYVRQPAAARRLFRLMSLAPGPHVTPRSAGALAGVTEDETEALLRRLTAAHLTAQPVSGRYTYHDLLRLYAAERAAVEDTAADRRAALRRWFEQYLRDVAAAAELLYPEKLRLPLPPGETPNAPSLFDEADHADALAWLDVERPNLVAAVRHAADHGPHQVAWLLADGLRGYFWLRLHAADWLAVGEAARDAATAAGDAAGLAAAHLSIADAHMLQTRYPAALQHYGLALELHQRRGYLPGQSVVVGNLGNVYWRSGQLHQAAEHFAQGLELDRRIGWTAGEGVKLGNLASVFRALGRLEQSAEHHLQSLAIDRACGSRAGEAVELADLAEVYHALGCFDEAEQHVEAALAIQREVGDRASEAESLRISAAIRRDRGKSALDLADAALMLARATGERRVEADTLNTIATVYLQLGRRDLAVEYHRRAARVALAADSLYTRAEALLGLGYAMDWDHGQAMDNVAWALQASREQGYRMLEGQALTTRALLHLRNRRLSHAVEDAESALAVHGETGYRLGRARTYHVLGRALRHSGRRDDAARHWRRALDIFTVLGIPEADDVRARLATL
jgi:DNA-binding SARP family transcriptional activator/tetratricopeptide (TPR) repeat protein/transcriptional regulator with XRE-family HTH domain